jgi:hypothetical protein
MTIEEIVQEMLDLGITAKVVDGKLNLKGFDSRASKELLYAIDKNKEELIDLFSKAKQETLVDKISSTTLEFSNITRLPQFIIPEEEEVVVEQRSAFVGENYITRIFMNDDNVLTVQYSSGVEQPVVDLSFDYGYFSEGET